MANGTKVIIPSAYLVRPRPMIPARRSRGHLPALASLVFVLLATMLSFGVSPVLAESPANVPTGFADQLVFGGLDNPMAIAFAPDGEVFVAEKRGVILRYSSLSDTTPTVFADLNTNVHNYWDRGMMGLAVDPAYPTRPYVYVLYAYNHVFGDPAAAPKWPSNSGSGYYGDRCPSPPGANTDGCVISGRLSRLTSSGGVMSGSEHVLIEDWCQQFPSHSLGNLMFGADGSLYVSAGEGAGFSGVDYGQFGGSLTDTPTPANPCGDPPGGVGVALSPPTAEGGSLRAQDLRTAGDPVGLDGAILRIDPTTGAGWPTNALAGSTDPNARRIIGYGLRNPFRFTIRPGTNEIWLADVGFATWEEIDRLPDPTATPRNFGWPCWEGNATFPTYQALGTSICNGLSAGEVTTPFYEYQHGVDVASGDGCGTSNGGSISGVTFLPASSTYPGAYDGALFFADYVRRCIWYLPGGAGGLPSAGPAKLFADLDRTDASARDGGAVFLTTDPNGELLYVDYDRGEVRRIHYYGLANPPVAKFTTTPSSGPAPLQVSFDASTSTSSHGALTYAWDLNGDGLFDDATGATAQRTYSSLGQVTVGLKVTDPANLTGMTTHVISVDESPPSVTIDLPDPGLHWKVGDTIDFSGSATDLQDGVLPASAFDWTIIMRHCPSGCHSHIIETDSGVASGSFVAPDHEVPSHIQLSVTVTDSAGLTGSASIDLYPLTGTVTTTSAPTGIATTAGDDTGQTASATAIVKSSVSVSAPASSVIGEDIWSFQSWSDGGARTHQVPVVTGTTALTATYTRTGTVDASDTCSGAAPPVDPTGRWQTASFGVPGDVDWYRFKLTATKRVRLVLGDLTVPGRLALYQGCSKLLRVSDRPGLGSEELIQEAGSRELCDPREWKRRSIDRATRPAHQEDAGRRPCAVIQGADRRQHPAPRRGGL